MCDEKAIKKRFNEELGDNLSEDDKEVLEDTIDFEKTSEKISFLF